ncbi:MAG: hypothetical protein RLZZ519_3485, partial [Bacteroidota bacterium]
WLHRAASLPEDTILGRILAELNTIPKAGQHPLAEFEAVSSAFADKLPLWFSESLNTGESGQTLDLLRKKFKQETLHLKQVLEKRLQGTDLTLVGINTNQWDQIEVTVLAEDQEALERRVILPVGEIEFYETFTFEEMHPGVYALKDFYHWTDSTGVERDFLELLVDYDPVRKINHDLPPIEAGKPILAFVHESRMKLVDSLLSTQTAKDSLPYNLRFAWCKDAAEDWPAMYPLCGLKTSPEGKPRLGGSTILYARHDFEVGSGMPMISLTMNDEGSAVWERVTRSNIGRQIAIVFDGVVYTYPTVQTEIVGGRSQITGNFTVEEAKNLAQVLQGGAYPAQPVIVSKSQVDTK